MSLKRVKIQLGLTIQEGEIVYKNLPLKKVTIRIDKIDGIKVDPIECDFPTSILRRTKNRKK